MQKLLTTTASSVAALLLAQASVAEPAIYRDGTLYIDHGAIVATNGSVSYFDNIYLRHHNNDSRLYIDWADPREQSGTSVEHETGVYEADTTELTISHGALVLGDGNAEYFTDILLRPGPSGGFLIYGATPSPLVDIDSVTVDSFDNPSAPNYVTLNVTGTKSNSCAVVDGEKAAYSRQTDGNVFTVALAETGMSGTSCQEEPTPFNTTVEVDVCSCNPGDYTAIVNGQSEVEFTVPE